MLQQTTIMMLQASLLRLLSGLKAKRGSVSAVFKAGITELKTALMDRNPKMRTMTCHGRQTLFLARLYLADLYVDVLLPEPRHAVLVAIQERSPCTAPDRLLHPSVIK